MFVLTFEFIVCLICFPIYIYVNWLNYFYSKQRAIKYTINSDLIYEV